MASPQSAPTDERDQDSKYNPGEQAYREGMGAGYVADEPANHDSLADVKKSEENGDDASLKNGFYRPGGTGTPRKITIKGLLNKKGPLALIITLLIGGGGAFSIFFTPGLGIIQLKEVLTGDLNDQLSAFDIRSDAAFKARLKSLQSSASVCSNSVKIRCQFASMSKRQIGKFEKAGFVIETEDAAFGRQKITSMVAPNNVKINDPQDLINERRDPLVRSALNKVHNPIYASLSDSTAIKVLKERFKTNKTKKLSGVTTDALSESLAESSRGDDLTGGGEVKTDANGDRYVDGEDGSPVFEKDNQGEFDRLLGEGEELKAKVANVTDTNVKAVTGVIGGALKGVSIIGVADAACTVYNTARIVEAASKASRSVQLAQYAMIFLGTADSIKAGTATPEEVEYLGTILTSTDTRKTITDELSTTTGNTVADAQANAQSRPNPFYGKNAFDSPGYAVAAYNDAPTLTTSSQQYMVGGGLSGTLTGITDSVANAVTQGDKSKLRGTCSVIQSWWVRGAGLVVGIAAAVGSFGASTVISIGASLAVGIALPFLEAALADIIAGKVVGPETKGVESGDAIFSGTGALLGGVAQARGLKPLTSSELENYLAKSNQVKNEYVAQGIYEAQATPFDIYNQYSFVGSFARSLNPTVISASGGVSQTLAAIPKFFSSTFASVVPSAHAAGTYNAERFTKCADEGYKELGIAADVFCNVRYGLSNAELNSDPDAVLTFMLDNGHIDTNGNAKSGAYSDFLKYCVDRLDGWGETGEEGDDGTKSTGAICMEVSDQNSNFRVFTIDKSVNLSMDDEEPSESAVTTGAIVSPVSPGFKVTSPLGPRERPCPSCSTYHQGTDYTTADKAVFAIMDGTVTGAGVGVNNIVSIKHADGLISTYWHMRNEDILVKEGDTVTAGQRIGTMGNEGQSNGVHLHFELDISQVADKATYDQYTKNGGGYNPGQRLNSEEYFKINGVAGF
jgi:Peptidase family M23